MRDTVAIPKIGKGRVTAGFDGSPHPLPSKIVLGLFLTKLGKHLVVLASVLILGQASGHLEVGQLGTFCLVVLSSIIHSVGKVYLSRAPSHPNRL